MSGSHTVSVIMPTKGLRARGALLKRAIESVTAQEGVRAKPIVVLNGQEVDPEIERWLRSDERVRVARLEKADLPASLGVGREMVDSPWFAELDDDDVLLPGALALRVRFLFEHGDSDAVVTNGYRGEPAGNVLHTTDMEAVAADPLRALLRQNWLLPGSWLCRTETVGGWLFEGMPPFMECTFLAVQLSTRCRTRYLDQPTVIWHTDTPGSASRSGAYILSEAAGLRRILELDLPPDIRAAYQGSMAGALHSAADWHLSEGRVGPAWKEHLASLRWPGGWRHLPFTRRLMLMPRRP